MGEAISKTLTIVFGLLVMAVTGMYCARKGYSIDSDWQISMLREKLGPDYERLESPGGDYVLYYSSTKPFAQKPVSVTSFVVLSKNGVEVLFEKDNFRGNVAWTSKNVIRLREEKGILLDNGTNFLEYYYDVSLGKRVDHQKVKEF